MLLHKFGNFASQLLQQSVQTKGSVLFGTLFQFIVCENMCNEQRMLKTDIEAVGGYVYVSRQSFKIDV